MAVRKRVSRVQKKDSLSLTNQFNNGKTSGESQPLAMMQKAKLYPQSLTPADIMQLQKTMGNKAVVQLMAGAGLTPEDVGLLPGMDTRSSALTSSVSINTSGKAAPIQRFTNPYTAEELGFPPPFPVAFPMQVIQHIVYQRANIPGAVLALVNGHPDNEPGHVLNKHYIPHVQIIDNLINNLVGNTRATIVANVSAILVALGIAFPVGVAPLTCRAHFDTWLDDAFVSIADNHNIIFRGPSTGDHGGTTLDNPAGGANSAAQLLRMAPHLANYMALNLWP